MNPVTAAFQRYLDLSHLPSPQRIPTLTLLRFYIAGLVACCLYALLSVALYRETALPDTPVILAAAILAAIIHLTRSGFIKLGALILCGLTTAFAAAAMIAHGGLTAAVCLPMITILILSFVHARSEIVTASVTVFVGLGGVAWWLHETSSVTPPYEFTVSMITFATLVTFTCIITVLCSRINQRAHREILESIDRLEEARTSSNERRRLAEDARLRAELTRSAKTRFLANMSHEVRTPLNAILGYAEIVRDDLSEVTEIDPVHAQDAATIHEAGSQLLATINDVLDLSRIEAGKMPIVPRACRIQDVTTLARKFIDERHTLTDTPPAISWVGLDVASSDEIFCDPKHTAMMLAQLALLLEPRSPITIVTVEWRDGICLEVVSEQTSVPLDGPRVTPRQELRQLLFDAYRELLDELLAYEPVGNKWTLTFPHPSIPD